MNRNDDYLRDLDALGVTARIKRLSDTLSASIRELYGKTGLDLEPSWHLVFLLLREQPEMTMSEVAAACRLTQPAITRIIGGMQKKGYVTIRRDKQDSRKKLLRLTGKAHKNLPLFEAVWDAGQRAVREILEANRGFMPGLAKFEAAIAQESFESRALNHLARQSESRGFGAQQHNEDEPQGG